MGVPAITLQTQESVVSVEEQPTIRDSSEVLGPTGRRGTSGSERVVNSSSGYSTNSSIKGSALNAPKVSLTSLSSAAGSFTAKFSSASSYMGKTFTDTMSITGSEFSAGSGGYSSEDDFICLSAEGGMLGKGPKAVDYDQELKPVNNYKPEEEFLGEERNEMPVSIWL